MITGPKQLSRAPHIFSLGITWSNTFMLDVGISKVEPNAVNIKKAQAKYPW